MMIQQLRVRTKTYGDRRFDKTASTLWNNLRSKIRNEQSLDFFLRNMFKIMTHNNMIKIISDLRQVDGFFGVLRFPPPVKLPATI